jgi:hypothetical protein
VAPGKGSFPAGDQAWQTSLKAEEYTSTWGHPYGKTLYVLKAGESISIRIPADILSVAWLDREDGGTFQVSVDGKVAWEQDTRTPFITSEGTSHYIENRRAINGLEHGDHLLTITATEGTVRILGAFGYTL